MEEAIGYARISTEDQSTNSIPGQVADITAYCQRNKLHLHKIFIDKGQSAFNFQRKEWKEVEQFLKTNRKVKYLVIYAMDRFSRANLVDALQKMDEIQKRTGVKILTVSDPVNLDIEDFGTDLRRIMELMFSNYELKKIRKRTSDGLYQAMFSGRFVNKAPYGYLNARDETAAPILQVDEEKAYVVRLVFRSYLKGLQIEEIRKLALANGLKLKGNSTIRRILSNPVYAGLIQLPKHGYNAPMIVKALHIPLISESDYWLVQEKIKGKTRGTQRHENVYLKGVLHCHCEQKMSSDKSKGGSGKYYHYYVCKYHPKRLSAVKLHKQMNEILDLLSLPGSSVVRISEHLRGLISNKLSNKGGDIMRAKMSLKKVQDRIIATQEKFLSQPDISEKVYNKVVGGLKADEKRLQTQITDLNSTEGEYYSIMDELLPKLSNTRQAFENMPLIRKAAFLKLLFGNSLWYEGGIFRTNYLHYLFAHNIVVLKEKGLLSIEQSNHFPEFTPNRSGNGSLFELEELIELLQVFAA